MTQSTERLSIYGAVNLLECNEFEPPPRFEGDTMKWFREEVQAGRLVCHDRTGRKIEPGERRGLLLGLNDETTSIARLNAWLASIDHLRRIPETACVPTAAVILERHDEDSRPVFRMPLCPAEVPAELLALPADTFVVCVEESGPLRGAHYTTAAKLADYIGGRLPAGAPAVALEPASAPSAGRIDDVLIDAALKGMSEAGLRELRARLELMHRTEEIQRRLPPAHLLEAAERVSRVCGPSPVVSHAPASTEPASAPAVAAPEPAQKQKKPRRSWWDEIVGYLAEVWRKWKGGSAKEFYKELESRAGSPDSPLEVSGGRLKVRSCKQSIAPHTMETRLKWVKAAAGMR